MGKATIRTSKDSSKTGYVRKGKRRPTIKIKRSHKQSWILLWCFLNTLLGITILLKLYGVLDKWLLKIL